MASIFDEDVVVTTLIGLLIVLVAGYLWKRQRSNKIPPGPWSWPFIGAIPSLILSKRRGLLMHEYLEELAARYGQVCSLKLGSKLLVSIADMGTTREVFQGPDFADRPVMTDTTDLVTDVVFGSGAGWKAQRKFFLTVFRGFGVGKLIFEKRISDEVSAAIKEFEILSNQPFNPKRILANVAANVTFAILLGKRYDHKDPEFKQIYDLVCKVMELNTSGGLYSFLPILKYLNPSWVRTRSETAQELYGIIRRHIDEHKERLECSSEKTAADCIDAYLLEMELERLSDSTSYFTETNLIHNITNLAIAGMETSAHTLAWCLLYVAAFPDIQERLQNDIDDTVGRGRMVTLSDATNLSYVQAAILEVMRIRPVSPLSAPHLNSQEAAINGYTIPKDTVVMANIWAMHHDKQHWDNPEEFRPDRFLKEEAGSFVICGQERIIPFGIGRRVCAGEKIARSELFLIFANLLQQFTFTLADDEPVSFRAKPAFTLQPPDYQICATLRNLKYASED